MYAWLNAKEKLPIKAGGKLSIDQTCRWRIAFLLSVLVHRFSNQPSHNAFFKRGLAVLLGNAQEGAAGAFPIVIHIQNELLLEFYKLSWLTNLSALRDFAGRLNKSANLFAVGHLYVKH